MSLHLTERDRQVCDLGAAHQQTVREFEEAEANGTLTQEHFDRRRQAKAALDGAAALPPTYKCSDGDCQDESEIGGHVFYTVVAWSKHIVDGDRWVYQEFDKRAVRHFILCEGCDQHHGLREKLHERDLDEPIADAKRLVAEVEMLRADKDRLARLLAETEQQVAELRLKLSQQKRGRN
jgi:hypothetical protein